MDLQPLRQVEVSKGMKTARNELGGGLMHILKRAPTGFISCSATQVQVADPKINTKVKDARSMLTAR